MDRKTLLKLRKRGWAVLNGQNGKPAMIVSQEVRENLKRNEIPVDRQNKLKNKDNWVNDYIVL